MNQPSRPHAPAVRESSSSEEVDLGRLLATFVDHKWLIASVTGVFAAIGIAYALLATPIYQADALVQVEQPNMFSNPLQDVSRMLGQEPSNDTEIQILQSRLVLGQTVDQLELDSIVEPHRFPIIGNFLVRLGMERPAFAGKSVWAGEYINLGEFEVDSSLYGRTFTLESLEGRSYVLRMDGETIGEGRIGSNEQFLDGLLTLRVAELNAGKGASFDIRKVSQLSAINALRSNFAVAAMGRESNVLALTVSDSNPQRAQQIANAISQIYLQQNVQRSSAEAEKSLEFLQQQLPEVRVDLDEAENKLNAYRTQQDSVDLSLETQSILQRVVNLDAQINELEFAEADISRRFTPSHPTYSALLQKKTQLQRERENFSREINNLPETQQQILRLQRDVDVNQQVYIQLLNRMQETNIARASTVGNIRILDTAVTQPNPVAPRKTMVVAIALMLGLLGSIGWVILRGLFNRGVESAEQIEAIDLPVYATVPLSEEQLKLVRKTKVSKNAQKQNVISGLLATRNPTDLSIEAIRNLRTSLHFAMLEATDNILMITGPSPGIGKSFIASNLAAVCAQAGQHVLLIDADMRKGHIHHVFGLDSGRGMSDYLSGQKSLTDVVQNTDVQGLEVLPRGNVPPNPSELLMQSNFSNLLKDIQLSYDLIIIDTPPVLAVTDAMIIGRQVGTALMVTRFELNPIREIEMARKRLENAGVLLKGAILNAIERKSATAYGYGYYNYTYK